MRNLSEYIEISQEKRFGKPCIKGTRISVYDIIKFMASGMSKKDILRDFPELDEQKINACLFFVSDRNQHLRVA